MVLVLAQEGPRLGAELLEVPPAAKPGRSIARLRAHLVLEVGVDDSRFCFSISFTRSRSRRRDQLQHRDGHVLPPLVGLHLLDQRHLLSHHRDGRLLLQQAGDRLDLVAQPLESRARTRSRASCRLRIRRSNRFASSASASSSAAGPRPRCASSPSRSRATASSHASGLGVLLDQPALRPHDEVVEVHRRDLAVQRCGQRAAHSGVGRRVAERRTAVAAAAGPAATPASLVQLADQLQPRLEQPLAQRLARRALGRLRVLAEELQVLAVVEDVEELACPARAEQVRAQPRAAPEHLPELGLRAHQLEEDQVHDLRDVDAGVEHVHRDGDVRRLAPWSEKSSIRLCAYSVLKVMTRANSPL